MSDVLLSFRGSPNSARPTSPFLRDLIAQNPDLSRRRLSVKVCEAWQWVQPNGQPRDMVCRSLMLALHRAGHLELPAKRQSPPNNAIAASARGAGAARRHDAARRDPGVVGAVDDPPGAAGRRRSALRPSAQPPSLPGLQPSGRRASQVSGGGGAATRSPAWDGVRPPASSTCATRSSARPRRPIGTTSTASPTTPAS